MISAKKGKKGAKKWRNGKGKKSVLFCIFPVPVFYLSFPSTSLMLVVHRHGRDTRLGMCLVCTVLLLLNSLQMGPHHSSTYKTTSPVPPFSDVGAHVQ